EMSEAYYIEKPTERHQFYSPLDDGIRNHSGAGIPMAAWYRGPFFCLLRGDFGLGLALIDKMLDGAARSRGGSTVRLDILGSDHDFFGDEHVWGWYRGSTVGPYPCVSALLALEKHIDQFVSVLQIP